MILFQWLSVPILAVAFLFDFARIFRVPGWRRFCGRRAGVTSRVVWPAIGSVGWRGRRWRGSIAGRSASTWLR